MHDPLTQAFNIPYPWRAHNRREIRHRAEQLGVDVSDPQLDFWRTYRNPFITIWHRDPEADGTDDSCGWFIRVRHCDKKIYEQIVRDFTFEWSHGVPFGWFDEDEQPNFSVQAIVLSMFQRAAHTAFGHDWKRTHDFMQQHGIEILLFAENQIDSLYTFVTRHYEKAYDEPPRREERIREAAACVYSWIMRATRPWYRHPRWHVRHWEFQIHPLQQFKRWAFSRCCRCGRGFVFGYCPVTDQWDGDKPRWFRGERGVYHHDCSNAKVQDTACATNGSAQ